METGRTPSSVAPFPFLGADQRRGPPVNPLLWLNLLPPPPRPLRASSVADHTPAATKCHLAHSDPVLSRRSEDQRPRSGICRPRDIHSTPFASNSQRCATNLTPSRSICARRNTNRPALTHICFRQTITAGDMTPPAWPTTSTRTGKSPTRQASTGTPSAMWEIAVSKDGIVDPRSGTGRSKGATRKPRGTFARPTTTTVSGSQRFVTLEAAVVSRRSLSRPSITSLASP
jgi:hypothetical protein